MRLVAGSPDLLACMLVSGCGRRPPPMPYMTVGLYEGRCGYDYNGVAMKIEAVAKAAKTWRGSTEAALLFRFEPAPVHASCIAKAGAALVEAGFGHVWMIVTPHRGPGERPIMP